MNLVLEWKIVSKFAQMRDNLSDTNIAWIDFIYVWYQIWIDRHCPAILLPFTLFDTIIFILQHSSNEHTMVVLTLSS